MDKTIAEDIKFLEAKQYQYWHGSQNWEGFQCIINRLKKLEGPVSEHVVYTPNSEWIRETSPNIEWIRENCTDCEKVPEQPEEEKLIEPLPDNLEALAKKLFSLYSPKTAENVAWELVGNWRKVASYVAPHLTGLRPGEFTGLKLTKGSDGCWIHFSGGNKHAALHVENNFGKSIVGMAIQNWFDENYKEPKAETYIKPLSEIIRMAESGEYGTFDGRELSADGLVYQLSDLFRVSYAGPLERPDDYPPAWKEER